MQTIFALATARGKAGVAVIRISGPEAFKVGARLVRSLPAPGRFGLRDIRDSSGSFLDRALILTFQEPGSFTGEDTVELQLHGSIAVIRAVERAIRDTGLARLAEAGEFTRRALMNDMLDLTQVEGLGRLIDAETEAQRQIAQASFDGGLTKIAEGWRTLMIRAAALLEASIDFVDEDVPVDVVPEVREILERLVSDLDREIAGSGIAERLNDGFEVAILGAPNAGKSTLLNALAGRDVAITSEIAGTTRDVIEARLDLSGLPVTFLDTAGIRETSDVVEGIGVERAIQRAVSADIRILLVTDSWITPVPLIGKIDFSFRAKADVGEGTGISGLTGNGIDDMMRNIEHVLSEKTSMVRTAVTDRQGGAMKRARVGLESALLLLKSAPELELVAEHVRDAQRSLDSLTGRVDVECLLGEIFSRFCIGK